MNSEKYIGYVDIEIANSMPSSGLCRVRCAVEALILEKRCPCVACWSSSLGIVRMSRQELTPREKAPHLPLAQTSLERALKAKMPVYGLSASSRVL